MEIVKFKDDKLETIHPIWITLISIFTLFVFMYTGFVGVFLILVIGYFISKYSSVQYGVQLFVYLIYINFGLFLNVVMSFGIHNYLDLDDDAKWIFTLGIIIGTIVIVILFIQLLRKKLNLIRSSFQFGLVFINLLFGVYYIFVHLLIGLSGHSV